jgi:hypothetical protein
MANRPFFRVIYRTAGLRLQAAGRPDAPEYWIARSSRAMTVESAARFDAVIASQRVARMRAR